MANYELIAKKESENIFIVKSTGFLESIKLAWYVLRYPDRTPVLMVVDKDWCDDHLNLDQEGD